MPHRSDAFTLTDDVYVELVRSLFMTLLPTSIIGTSFTLIGSAIALMTKDLVLTSLLAAGVLAAIARLSVLMIYRNDRAWASANAIRAGRAERRYAYCYFTFAVAFGAFTARAFVISPFEARMLLVGLVFGYGAGVAAGVALRPWISLPSITIGVVPLVVSSALVNSDWSFGLGLLTAVFLAGGIESILRRYRKTARLLSVERMLSRITRQDEITGLANEIALRLRFATIVGARSARRLIAIHVLKLEGLNKIDQERGYGSCVSVLRAAASRLNDLASGDDVVARLGGDTLVVLQVSPETARDAEQFALNARTALSASYDDRGAILPVRVSSAFVLDTHRHAMLDSLLSEAGRLVSEHKPSDSVAMAYRAASPLEGVRSYPLPGSL